MNRVCKMVAGWMLVMVFLGILPAFGAALTADRDTPQREGEAISVGVYTGTVIYAGAMVAINGSGYAVNAADATGLRVIGRAEQTVNATYYDSGDLVVPVSYGCFGWENAGDIGDADIGDIAFVVDNQTVSQATNGTYHIIAGMIRNVDADYVWVDTFHLGRTAGSFTTISASGNATLQANVAISSNLAVTGNAAVTGTSSFTGVPTFGAKPVFSPAAVAAPTNTATAGWAITINGTNYVVAVYPN